MQSIKKFTTGLDILGMEASLYSFENSKHYKSLFGGLLSILVFILSLSGSIYFINHFLQRKNLELISNEKNDYYIDFYDFTDLPFMFRISGDLNAVYNSSIYFARGLMVKYDADHGSNQIFSNLFLESCNSDKHFPKKKELFQNITEIETYFCINWEESKVPLYENEEEKKFTLNGVYGTNKFTYLMFFFKACYYSENTDCLSSEVVDNLLSSSYLDIITLSNFIYHKEENPKSEYVHKSRFAVSFSVYKRIWFYFQKIVYITDAGYIFEDKISNNFYNVHSNKIDVDIRKANLGEQIWLSVLNYSTAFTYSRVYEKAQSVIANIGEIIKGIYLCAYILCYPVSLNTKNVNLVNSFYNKEDFSFNEISILDKTQKMKLEIDNNNFSNLNIHHCLPNCHSHSQINNINKENILSQERILQLNINKNFNDKCKEEDTNKKVERIQIDENDNVNSLKQNKNQLQLNFRNNIEPQSFIKNKFALNLFEYCDLFQIFFPIEKKKVFNNKIEKINSTLNISNIISSLQKLELIKTSILDNTQSQIINFMYSNNFNYSFPLKEAIYRIKSKPQLNNIDLLLIDEFDYI